MERMAANGVDPQGMIKLLELLEREAHDMPEGLAFLSSHPLTTERIAAARTKAADLKPNGEGPGLAPLFEAVRKR
jgi:predicted Zn-dependent protease